MKYLLVNHSDQIYDVMIVKKSENRTAICYSEYCGSINDKYKEVPLAVVTETGDNFDIHVAGQNLKVDASELHYLILLLNQFNDSKVIELKKVKKK